MHYRFRQAHLAGQLEGEGIPGQAGLQLEEGLYAGRVEEHRTVHHAGVGAGSVELEVGVVGGDHPVHSAAVQFGEYGFCDSASCRRLGSRTELIYQNERARICEGEHLPHIGEEGGIGAEVVLEGLVIPYAHGYPFEYGQFRGLGGGYQHPPLEHILKQAYGLQADGFSAGVGAGYKQYVLGGIEGYGQRDYAAPLLGEGLLQQGMAGLAQGQGASVGYYGHTGAQVQGGTGLGHQEIHLPHEGGSGQQVGDVGTEEFGEFRQDALDFPALREMQLRYLVLQLYQLRGLYEGCLSAGGFPVHETAELALGCGCHRDEVLPFAYGDSCVGIRDSGGLGLGEYGGRSLGHRPFLAAYGLAYVEELVGGGILDVPVFVEYLLNAAVHLREDVYLPRHPFQVGIDSVLDAAEEVYYAAGGVDKRP